MALFADRIDAGRQLAELLTGWRGRDAVVLGIPRGGVVVAAEVARVLDAPLGVAIARKLGVPWHEELAFGAIAEGVRVVSDDALRGSGVTPEQQTSVEEHERVELHRREARFGAGLVDVDGRTAIVVDDGVATGATATAACRSVRTRGAASVVLAAPVAPAHWHADATVVDEFVCPHRERNFWSVGQFYDDFTQTSDDEVARLLAEAS